MKKKVIKNKIIILKLFTTTKPISKGTKPFCEFEFVNDEQCNDFIKLLNSQNEYINLGNIILKRNLVTYVIKEIR